MKLNLINQNQTNFKAVYKPQNYKFTESQQRVIEDIENKLGNRRFEKDFSITPYGGDSVVLRQVEGFKRNPFNTDDLMFEKENLSIICSEKKLLDINKFDEAENEIESIKAKSVLSVARDFIVALGITIAIVAGLLVAKNNKNVVKPLHKIENRSYLLQDLFPKNSFDLTKSFIKK